MFPIKFENWIFESAYDNDDPPPTDPPPIDPPPTDPPPTDPPPTNKDRRFTQEEVNRMLADDKRKSAKSRQDTIDQLKTLRDSVTMTEKQKEELETRIEQLQNETLTAQELAKKEKEKLTKEYENKEKKTASERDMWRDRYAQSTIARELQDAAIEYKAISPVQIVNFLRPTTRLVEELKDGKPTGSWVPRVTFHDKDEKGEPITLELSVTEAVKRMSEMHDHWNLFNSGANGGVGGFNLNNPNPGNFRGQKPPKDIKDFKKWHAENVKG